METARKVGYRSWQKAVLALSLLVALLGTLILVGCVFRASKTVSEYGGKIGAAFVIVMVVGILSLWLFAATAAVLVHVSRISMEVLEALRSGSDAPEDSND